MDWSILRKMFWVWLVFYHIPQSHFLCHYHHLVVAKLLPECAGASVDMIRWTEHDSGSERDTSSLGLSRVGISERLIGQSLLFRVFVVGSNGLSFIVQEGKGCLLLLFFHDDELSDPENPNLPDAHLFFIKATTEDSESNGTTMYQDERSLSIYNIIV